ncbi:hypothetical protein Dimus_001700, partial [Dionaea muscipula]
MEDSNDANSSGSREDNEDALITKPINEGLEIMEKEGSLRSLGEEEMRGCALVMDRGDNRGTEVDAPRQGCIHDLLLSEEAEGPRDPGGDNLGIMVGPVIQLHNSRGPIFNSQGINLEVVLGPRDNPDLLISGQTGVNIDTSTNSNKDLQLVEQVGPWVRMEASQNHFREDSSGRQDLTGVGSVGS